MTNSEEVDRLRRIENQLSKIDEKFDVVIRLEEKHNSLAERVRTLGDKIHKHANILMELQYKTAIHSKTVGGAERLCWIATTAFIGFIAFAFRDLL